MPLKRRPLQVRNDCPDSVVLAQDTAPAQKCAASCRRRAARRQPYLAYNPSPSPARKPTRYGSLRRPALAASNASSRGHGRTGLPDAGLADADARRLADGREVADIGQCCPTSFTTATWPTTCAKRPRASGRRRREELRLRHRGSCGALPLRQYHQSYELALRNRTSTRSAMFLLGQQGLDQGAVSGGGLDLNCPSRWAPCGRCLTARCRIWSTRSAPTRPNRARPRARRRRGRDPVPGFARAAQSRQEAGRPRLAFATPYFVKAMKDVRRPL